MNFPTNVAYECWCGVIVCTTYNGEHVKISYLMSRICMSRMGTNFKKTLCRVWCMSRLDQVHTRHKHLLLCVTYGAICGVYFSLLRHGFWRLLHTWHTYIVSNFNATNPWFHTLLAYVFLVVPFTKESFDPAIYNS